ncbi:hypothetical protein Egran_04656 [Elaphomyces granulatus]|uniref:Uncharacterized protein n=1 Tax=Elaphomyces granulatus TaxID=519963 RepID=A0A232LTT9_9EURO|nr:hypothetical protein Egran_04656 [Elaphomyces granulatus]
MAFLQLKPHEGEQFQLLRDNGNASSPFSRMSHAFAENSWLISENPQSHGPITQWRDHKFCRQGHCPW